MGNDNNENNENNLEDQLDTSLVKPWYTSKRVLGTIAVLIQSILSLVLNIDLAPEAQEYLNQVVLSLGTLIGGSIALYGIFTSQKKVVMRKPKK